MLNKSMTPENIKIHLNVLCKDYRSRQYAGWNIENLYSSNNHVISPAPIVLELLLVQYTNNWYLPSNAETSQAHPVHKIPYKFSLANCHKTYPHSVICGMVENVTNNAVNYLLSIFVYVWQQYHLVSEVCWVQPLLELIPSKAPWELTWVILRPFPTCSDRIQK